MEYVLKSVSNKGTPGNQLLCLSQQKSYNVGRSQLNDFVLDDKTISRKHCIFHHRQHGLYIEVLKSLSGLRINGLRQIEGDSVQLINGDIIDIGQNYRYQLEIKSRDPNITIERVSVVTNENQNSLVKAEDQGPNVSDAVPKSIGFKNSYGEKKHVLIIPLLPTENIKKELDRNSSDVDLLHQTGKLSASGSCSETSQRISISSLSGVPEKKVPKDAPPNQSQPPSDENLNFNCPKGGILPPQGLDPETALQIMFAEVGDKSSLLPLINQENSALLTLNAATSENQLQSLKPFVNNAFDNTTERKTLFLSNQPKNQAIKTKTLMLLSVPESVSLTKNHRNPETLLDIINKDALSSNLVSELDPNGNILQNEIKTEMPDVPTISNQDKTSEILSQSFLPDHSARPLRSQIEHLDEGMQIQIEEPDMKSFLSVASQNDSPNLGSSLENWLETSTSARNLENEIKPDKPDLNKKSLLFLKVRSDLVAPYIQLQTQSQIPLQIEPQIPQSQNYQMQSLDPPSDQNNSEIRIKDEISEPLVYLEVEIIGENQGDKRRKGGKTVSDEFSFGTTKQEVPDSSLTNATKNQLGASIGPPLQSSEVEIIGEYLGEQRRKRRNTDLNNVGITIKQDPDSNFKFTQTQSGTQPIQNQTMDVENYLNHSNLDMIIKQEKDPVMQPPPQNQFLSGQSTVKTEKPDSFDNCSVLVNEIQRSTEVLPEKKIKKETDSELSKSKKIKKEASKISSSSDSSDSDSSSGSDSSSSTDSSSNSDSSSSFDISDGSSTSSRSDTSQNSFDSTSTLIVVPKNKIETNSEVSVKLHRELEVDSNNKNETSSKLSVKKEPEVSEVPHSSINENQTSAPFEENEYERSSKISQILKSISDPEITKLIIEAFNKEKVPSLNKVEKQPQLEKEERIIEKQLTSKNVGLLVPYDVSDEEESVPKAGDIREESETDSKNNTRYVEKVRYRSRKKSYKKSQREMKSDKKKKRDSGRKRKKERHDEEKGRRRDTSRRRDSGLSGERCKRIRSPKKGYSDSSNERYKKIRSSEKRDKDSSNERYKRIRSSKKGYSDSSNERYKKIRSSEKRDSDLSNECYKRIRSPKKRDSDSSSERYKRIKSSKERDSDSSNERYKRIRSPKKRDGDSRNERYKKIRSPKIRESDSDRECYRRIKSPKRKANDSKREIYKRRNSYSNRRCNKSRSPKRRDSDSERGSYTRRDSDSERDNFVGRNYFKRKVSSERESYSLKRKENLKRRQNPKRRGSPRRGESPRRRESPKRRESYLRLSRKNLESHDREDLRSFRTENKKLTGNYRRRRSTSSGCSETIRTQSIKDPKIQTKSAQKERIFDDRVIRTIDYFFPKVSDEEEEPYTNLLSKSTRSNKIIKPGKIKINLDHTGCLKRIASNVAVMSGERSGNENVLTRKMEKVAMPLAVQPTERKFLIAGKEFPKISPRFVEPPTPHLEPLPNDDPFTILMKPGIHGIVELQSQTSISQETVDSQMMSRVLENKEISESVTDPEIQEQNFTTTNMSSPNRLTYLDKELDVPNLNLDARGEQILAEPQPLTSGETLRNCGYQLGGEQRDNSFMTAIQYPRMQAAVVGAELSVSAQESFQEHENKMVVNSEPEKRLSGDINHEKMTEETQVFASAETLESTDMADKLLLIILTWGPIAFQSNKIWNGSPILSLKNIKGMMRSFENYAEYHKTVFNILCLDVSCQIQNVYAYGVENTVFKECQVLPDITAKVRIKDTQFYLLPFLLKLSFPINTEDYKLPIIGDLLEINIFNFHGQSSMVFGFIKKIVMSEITDDSPKKFISYIVTVIELGFNIYESQVKQVRIILNLRSFMEKANAVTRLRQSPLLPYILTPSSKILSEEPRRLLRREELITQEPLDQHQLRAISKITEAVMSPDPRICIVEGSPGTGKTNIIVNSLVELLCKPKYCERNEKLKILVCGSSNVMFDQIILKIQSLNIPNDVIKMVHVENEEEASKRTGNMSLDFLVRKHLEEDLGKYYKTVGQKSLEDQALFYKEKTEYLCQKFNEERYSHLGLQMLALKIYYKIAKSGRTVKQILPQEWKQLYKNGENTYLKGSNLIFCSVPNLTSYCAMEEFRSENTIPVCFVDDASEIFELDMLKVLPFGVKTLVLLGDNMKKPMTHELSYQLVSLRWGSSLFSRILSNFAGCVSSPMLKLKTQYRITKEIEHWLIHARIFGLDTSLNSVGLSVPFPLHALRIFNLIYTEDFVDNEAVFASRVIQCIASFGDLRRLQRSISVGVVISNIDAKERVDQEIENRMEEIVPGKAKIFNIETNTIDGFFNLEKDIILASCIRNKHLVTEAGFQRFYSTLTKAKHCLIIYGRFLKVYPFKENNCGWHSLVDYARNVVNVSVYIEYTELRRDLIR